MKKIKILIADDEELLQELYEMILESDFICETVKAGDGNEAIAALKKFDDFDLILSDFNMPGATGGKLYLYNKTHGNIPFFLFSGGELQDYLEFNDFFETNKNNHFFNKPFNEKTLIAAVHKIIQKEETNLDPSRYVKVKLQHYLQYTASAAEVYIKLSEDKFTKIININPNNLPDIDLLNHYKSKGFELVYIERSYLSSLLQDAFHHFNARLIAERKPEHSLVISGLKFNVSYEGLAEIGISGIQIEKINEVIEETLSSLLHDPLSQEQFRKLCEREGFAIGHSMLIMYISGRIARECNMTFSTTMKKLCTAAFYHDFSLFELDELEDEMKISSVTDKHLLKLLTEHPVASAQFLPKNSEVIEDTRRIILEHHELPNGDGYPKKLNAHQIAPLSCLFILSQEITFCLIRNNFSPERLKDFLHNSEPSFNQGNFNKFFKAAYSIFVS